MDQKLVTLIQAKIAFNDAVKNRTAKVSRDNPFHNAYWYKGEWLFSVGYATLELANKYADKTSYQYNRFCAQDGWNKSYYWSNSYYEQKIVTNDGRNSVFLIGQIDSMGRV